MHSLTSSFVRPGEGCLFVLSFVCSFRSFLLFNLFTYFTNKFNTVPVLAFPCWNSSKRAGNNMPKLNANPQMTTFERTAATHTSHDQQLSWYGEILSLQVTICFFFSARSVASLDSPALLMTPCKQTAKTNAYWEINYNSSLFMPVPLSYTFYTGFLPHTLWWN